MTQADGAHGRRTPVRLIGALVLLAVVLTACGRSADAPTADPGRLTTPRALPDPDRPADHAAQPGHEPGERAPTPVPPSGAPDVPGGPTGTVPDRAEDPHGAEATASPRPEADPAEVDADELGLVPVLMYHQLRDDGGGQWDLSPDEFRAELTRLFDAGYVPIRAVDLARGFVDVPAGMSPIVLTFDDATRSQAHLDEDGRIAADSSIGILLEVADNYDHVEPIASLYLITSSLFGGTADGPDVVRRLHELGMELGNHSHTHPNLGALDAEGVQRELATNVAEMGDIVPGAEVSTLALPLGVRPQDRSLASNGGHEAITYHHEGVLLVGYEPAPSPFHAGFDPGAIPRIQTHPDPAYQFGSAWWLDQIDRGESYRRYVSDGDPGTISFPRARADELHPDLADRANPY